MSVEVADGGGPSGIAILISRTIHSEEGEAGMLVGIMAISISTFTNKSVNKVLELAKWPHVNSRKVRQGTLSTRNKLS